MTASRWNRPNAPDTISSAFSAVHPVRAPKNARKYSTSWNMASLDRGSAVAVTRPCATWQPLAIRTVPPVATVRSGSSMNGSAAWASASCSRIESASTETTTGLVQKLMPALSESALPPFSLSITSSGSSLRGAYTPRTGRCGRNGGVGRGTGRSSKILTRRCSVSSAEPSLMTTTSIRG